MDGTEYVLVAWPGGIFQDSAKRRIAPHGKQAAEKSVLGAGSRLSRGVRVVHGLWRLWRCSLEFPFRAPKIAL